MSHECAVEIRAIVKTLRANVLAIGAQDWGTQSDEQSVVVQDLLDCVTLAECSLIRYGHPLEVG